MAHTQRHETARIDREADITPAAWVLERLAGVDGLYIKAVEGV